MRLIWGLFGALALLLGTIGIALPLLPTVPFLLLSAFCFARSSERAHHWLLNHPTFGPPIRDWQRSGAIGRRPKIIALTTMAAGFLLSVAIGLKPWVLAAQALTLCGAALFIWTRPEA